MSHFIVNDSLWLFMILIFCRICIPIFAPAHGSVTSLCGFYHYDNIEFKFVYTYICEGKAAYADTQLLILIVEKIKQFNKASFFTVLFCLLCIRGIYW